MEKLLLVVEASFQVTGIGLVLTPCVAMDWVGDLKSGHVAPVRLKRPDEATTPLTRLSSGSISVPAALF